MELLFGAAKIRKYASRESGDTLELIERPHGGLSLILVDGQRSGRSAKRVSNIVARKCVQLLGEGVRDGAAARAANDYLFTYGDGRVTATLNIVSVDAVSQTIVVSRNNAAPVLVHTPQRGLYLLAQPADAIGTRRDTRPDITEIPIELGPLLIVYTDGLRHAGRGRGRPLDVEAAARALLAEGVSDPQAFADRLLKQALALDDGRPGDDISVLVLRVRANLGGDEVRRIAGRLVL